MADIREHYEQQGDNRFLRATSSQRKSDLNRAEMGADVVAANVAANAARKWGVTVFGRLHNQQWDDRDLAQDCADKIGGEVVEVN